MKFKISQEVFEKFPKLNVGVLVVKGIDNNGTSKDILELIKKREKKIRETFEKDKLSENPRIDVWRKAYSSFGAKPKNYRCSVENLYRMILDGNGLNHINKIVDIYNYISIKNMVPIGGDDLDKVDGDIMLRLANGEENFVELNSSEINHPKEGEIVYADNKEILCRRWNWRECDKSKMTEKTTNITLVIEGLGVSLEDLEKIIGELGELVLKYVGGKIRSFVLNKENMGVEI